MKVILAKTAGFCFGVKRAVDTVYEQLETHKGEKIYTYGPIIHNDEVIKDLQSKGVDSPLVGRRTGESVRRNRESSVPMVCRNMICQKIEEKGIAVC